MTQEQIEKYIGQIEEDADYLLEKGWVQTDDGRWLNPHDMLCYKIADAIVIENVKYLFNIGWKECYSARFNSLTKQYVSFFVRYIHPVSNRVYRYHDAICIAFDFNNKDDEYYKKSEHWCKKVNKMLEQENVVVKPEDFFTYQGTSKGYKLIQFPKPLSEMKDQPVWQKALEIFNG